MKSKVLLIAALALLTTGRGARRRRGRRRYIERPWRGDRKAGFAGGKTRRS